MAQNDSTATVAHDEEREEGINFKVPADFKLKVDLAVVRRRTTLRAFCIAALSLFAGIDPPDGVQVPTRE